MLWLGVQPMMLAKPEEALKLVNRIGVRRVRANIVRLVMSLPKTDATVALDKILPLLAAAPNDETRIDILTGIQQAIEDRKSLKAPQLWESIYPELSANAKLQDHADDLALKFGDARARTALKARMLNTALPATLRQVAIEKLAGLKSDGLAESLYPLLADPAVRGTVIRGLASVGDASTGPMLLKQYAQFNGEEKAAAILTLASRVKFAEQLLQAVENGTIPKSDITAFSARQIVTLNNKAITAQLGKVWGTVKSSNSNRAEQTARIKKLLTPDYVASANLEKGKILYGKQCATCHKLFGEGGEVGPELTGSQRKNLDYVLENVLDPNAVVPFDYKMTAFALADGRTITGLVKKETPQAITVRTVNELLIIPVADIESRKPTNHSVMPEGLFDQFKNDEIRDLIGYLAK
ncbi:MAG: c-type cytochrome, partial [Gemmataceae bacterium]